MTITYGNQTWSQDVSPFIGDEKAMSFSIAASTGANTNLQQLKMCSLVTPLHKER